MRSDLDDNKGRGLDIRDMRFGVNRQTLSTNFTITSPGSFFYFLDPGASSKDVTLPALKRGLVHAIVHSGAASSLVVKDAAGSTIATLLTTEGAFFVCSGVSWHYLAYTSTLALDPTELSSPDSSITVTVVGNAVTLVVNETNVDHDALANFVADEHVAHAGVSINAGTGLSGGGNISASRTINLNITGLVADTPVLADEISFYDISGLDHNKATLTDINAILDHNSLLNYSANRHIDHTGVSISAGEGLTGGGAIDANRTISLAVNSLTADTPVAASLFPFWDTVAGEHNKVALSDLATAMYGTSSGSALSRSDDTNVTLALGGSPTTALLKAVSLTLGWSGYLGLGRGGLGGSQAAATLNQVPIFPGSGGAAVPSTITASIINYTAPGTGGTAQTLQSRLERAVWAEEYGAACDNTTDDQTALQNAITAAIADNVELRISGFCKHSGTLTYSGALTVRGSGMWTSGLVGTGGATQVQNLVTSNDPVSFYDLAISSTSAKTGGAGIEYDGTGVTPDTLYSELRRVQFYNQATAIYFKNAIYWTVDQCFFLNIKAGDQVLIQNATDFDAGDSVIKDSWFFGGTTGTTHVRWNSGNSLRIVNNKFLLAGTADYGIYGYFESTAAGSLANITGNSFDDPAVASVVLQTASATALVTDAVINNNIFNGSPTDSFIHLLKFAGSSLTRIVINSNTIIQSAGAVVPIQNSDGTAVIISGNQITTTAANAISATAGASGKIGVNFTNGSYSPGGMTLIANSDLANSTISGVALGSNLATLSYGTHLTNSAGAASYNGSAASTLATDATSSNTASTIVARDASGNFSAGLGGFTGITLTLANTTIDFRGVTGNSVFINGTGSIIFNNHANDTSIATLTDAGALTIIGAFSATLANTATTSAVCYNTSTGLFTYNSTVGTCTVSSLSAKNLTAPLTNKEGFDIVMAMEPWRYTLKEGRPTYINGEQIGLIAEYANKVDARLVAFDQDGAIAGFRYEQYTAALTAALKYLKADNDNLRSEIELLKKALG